MQKKAEMGIGTLIIFIAMILVAAIAAGVLIQTATSLQNKALLTGERSKTQVSTSIRPMLVYAEDGETGHDVDQFFLKVKLAPGSDPIRLQDMLMEVSLNNMSNDLNYLLGYGCTIGNVTGALNEGNSTGVNQSNGTYFFAEYLISGANQAPGYLQRGDVIKICFETTRQVVEDETITITLIPKVGSQTIIETAMPDIITDKRVTIFP
jgi:flagellin FlaB